MTNNRPNKTSGLSLQKMPPANIEAEESVLSACLLSRDSLEEAVNLLLPDDFYRDGNGKVFKAMAHLFGKGQPVDLVTVSNHLMEQKDIEAVGGAAFLSRLVNSVPMAANIQHYCDIVRDKSTKRRLIQLHSDQAAQCYDDSLSAAEILDMSQSEIMAVDHKSGSGASWEGMSSVVQEAIEHCEWLENNRGILSGVDTGFVDLNKMTGGLQPADLIIVAGRPSMGKTALALNIGKSAAKAGETVAVFSLETSNKRLLFRMAADEAKVNLSKFRDGNFSRENREAIYRAFRHLYDLPMVFDDEAYVIQDIVRQMRRIKKERGLGLAIIDYLQLADVRGKFNRNDERVGAMSRMLKLASKELNIPIIALSQLNRKCEERPNKRPMMSDLRESGNIEQDADVIALIFYEEKYLGEATPAEKRGVVELNIAKQKEGPTGVVNLTWAPKTQTFGDWVHENYRV